MQHTAEDRDPRGNDARRGESEERAIARHAGCDETAASLVVATAGHVDHGKSTLVRALTGTDPDRLQEEQRRSMSIDLGFAFTVLPSGRPLAFVDVPGHLRFIRTMLAGVSAVDAALLVVDAREGWMPQSEEHLQILEVLGVRSLVVAVSKGQSVEEARRHRCLAEVRERLSRSAWPTAPIVQTDAICGTGLDELREELERVPLGRHAQDVRRPRLWVDRAFTIHGTGTVVTGTLTGGTLDVGERLTRLPDARSVRVRSIESGGQKLEVAPPGRRVALNLSDIDAGEVHRGDVIVRADQWHAATVFDASVRVLATRHASLARRGAHLLGIGSAEHEVQVLILGGDCIVPGESGTVRIHLPVELPLVPGDRFVLRDAGRDETVGGGEVLEVDPLMPATRARPDRSRARVVAEHGWIDARELERRTGLPAEADVATWCVHPPVLDAYRAALVSRLELAGPTGLDLAALDEREQAMLALLDDVIVHDTRVAFASENPLEHEPWLAELRRHLFDPPLPNGVDAAVVRDLLAAGLVVRLGGGAGTGGVIVAREALDAATRVLGALVQRSPQGVTVAQVRDALASSRRIVVPLLEHLEATGRARRIRDRHVPM